MVAVSVNTASFSRESLRLKEFYYQLAINLINNSLSLLVMYTVEAKKGLEATVEFVFSKLETHEKRIFQNPAYLRKYVTSLSHVDALLRKYTNDSYPDLLGEVYNSIREKLGIRPEEFSCEKKGRKRPQLATRDVLVAKPVLRFEEQALYVKKSRPNSDKVQSGANYFAQVISSMASRYELDEDLLIKKVLDSEAASHVIIKGNKVIEVSQRVIFYKLVMSTAKNLSLDSE